MKPTHYFLSILVFVLVVSCCKEKPPVVPPNPEPICTPLPPCESAFGWEYVPVGTWYYSPYFNPNNEQEFLYATLSSGETSIFKYNLQNREKSFICTTPFSLTSSPQWSRKDWIVFSTSDYNVWKVKSNGDSLTQLTFTNNYVGASWSFSGNIIISNIFGGTAIRLNQEGTILDTLNIGLSSGCQFITDTTILIGVFIYNLNQRTYTWQANTLNEDYGYADIDRKNQVIVWCNGKRMYRTNLESKQHTKLKDICTSWRYLTPSINTSSSAILWGKHEFTADSTRTQLFTKNIIVKTDMNGQNEEVVEIPE